MSDTLIKRGTYRDIEYKVKFTSDKPSEWGSLINTFYVETNTNLCSGHWNCFENAIQDFEKRVDSWYEKFPDTVGGWLQLFESCIVQDGYEDWHVDEQSAMNILERYATWRGNGS